MSVSVQMEVQFENTMQCRVIYYSCFSQDDERLHDYNVKERVDSFIKAAQDQVGLLFFVICLLSNEKKTT